jgi:peptidoglycan L-alanyl-D-glutamate endopeptidase CwlK
MSDKITLQRIETAHPLLRDELKCIYADICKAITSPYALFRFSHVQRTFKEQDELYAKGRTTRGPKVTNAKGGDSFHNYGFAVDIVELLDKDKNGTFENASWSTTLDADDDGIEDWMEVVRIFKGYGWEWGGDWRFTDKPHFQKTFGYSINQLKTMQKDSQGYVLVDNNKGCKCKCK